jgi:hypothetical protein
LNITIESLGLDIVNVIEWRQDNRDIIHNLVKKLTFLSSLNMLSSVAAKRVVKMRPVKKFSQETPVYKMQLINPRIIDP